MVKNWCNVLSMEGVTVCGHHPECRVTFGRGFRGEFISNTCWEIRGEFISNTCWVLLLVSKDVNTYCEIYWYSAYRLENCFRFRGLKQYKSLQLLYTKICGQCKSQMLLLMQTVCTFVSIPDEEHFPKRPSDSSLHTLLKLSDVSVGFVTSFFPRQCPALFAGGCYTTSDELSCFFISRLSSV